MVWSSRRACLPEPEDWWRIIREDGYRELSDTQSLALGDIVVWVKKDDPKNEIIHVAKVCELVPVATGTFSEAQNRIPRALSKWDQTSGESIHAFTDVFLNGGESFTIRLFTDRSA